MSCFSHSMSPALTLWSRQVLVHCNTMPLLPVTPGPGTIQPELKLKATVGIGVVKVYQLGVRLPLSRLISPNHRVKAHPINDVHNCLCKEVCAHIPLGPAAQL